MKKKEVDVEQASKIIVYLTSTIYEFLFLGLCVTRDGSSFTYIGLMVRIALNKVDT